MDLIKTNRKKIEELCQANKVKELYIFGSMLTPEFDDESDVDMVVEFLPLDPLDYVDNYFDLKFGLEKALKRKVDLLEAQALRNPIFKKVVEETKKIIYDQGSVELVA
ncbi:MAG: nucleotidyltransferase domain-containing protein [Lewinellaceae bacterium]|nr:nucleotidyltransferase domain-containing protein [Lewinellaceae bacterium]